MDELDTLLLHAWNRVSKQVRRDPMLALKRAQRRFCTSLWTPLRECCVVLRGSDTRINERSAWVEPHGAIDKHEPHTVTLDGTLIRELTKPVMIDWPGVTLAEAAAMLGQTYCSLMNWKRKGVFEINTYPEFRFPDHRRRQYLWTPSPIDPNNFQGRVPHSIWGTLWQWKWENVPKEYQLTVQRVPTTRRVRGRDQFRGWLFICPGRMNREGEHVECGRAVRYLYLPHTMWSLAKAIGDDSGIEMPGESGLVGKWYPGWSDPVAEPGTRSFACKQCWGVQHALLSNEQGWNLFVTQISGGLLSGRDVPRPDEICPIVRRRRPNKQRKRKGAADASRAAAEPARAAG